jgi:hypothetical protein
MISLDDIEDMSPLTRDEIAAVAEHEHLADLSATLLSEYLIHQPKGPQAIQQMICEDIRKALHDDDLEHARALFGTLRAYVTEHPEAVRGVPG